MKQCALPWGRCGALLSVLMLAAMAAAAQQTAPSAPTPAALPAASTAQVQKLIQDGRFSEASQQLDALAAEKPEPAGVEKLRGMAFYQQSKLTEAEAAFARAVAQDSADSEAAQMQGVTLFRLGRPAEAVPLLEGSHISVTSANVDSNYVLGLCYMDTRRYDDARKAFAAQYSFPPEGAEAYLLAARLLFRREYLPAATTAAQKALALAPRMPLVHELLGEIALADARVPDAIAEFEQERAINPLYSGLYDRLGDAYLRAGDYAEAQQSLNRAVLLDPSATGPFILLGKVLLKQHDAALATQYLERAVRMDPGNFIAHGLLAQAYRAAGRTADAQRETDAGEKIQASATPKLGKP